MRYVPNLIPKEIKVLPDYFKGKIYAAPTKKKSLTVLSYLAAIIFFLFAFGNLNHPMPALLFAVLGFIILPPGHKWIENKFRFRLTTKIKTLFAGILLVVLMPLMGHYNKIDQQLAYELKVQTDKASAEKLAADKKEQDRKDSVHHILLSAAELQKNAKIDEALNRINYAASFNPNDIEKKAIEYARNRVLALQAFEMVRQGKYQAAIPELTRFLSSSQDDPDLLLNRAICYSKTGQLQEAVADLKPLVELGNEDAVELHDKINPVKKRVAYYVTRCNDGSSSNSKGRGACSGHGGVANWNEPVYEESRKYN